MSAHSTVLVTGASSGIGRVYAERFAKRGHDLVLVARDRERLETLAARLRKECNVGVDVLQTDLTEAAQLAKVESRLREDSRIKVLVNNAGAALSGGFLSQTSDANAKLISLNVVSVTRLAAAAAARFAQEGGGAIINIGSVVGLAPEFSATVYGATKAFVLFLSQGLQVELAAKGVYVQAVLPAATRTEIWERAGGDAKTVKGLMEVDELVDAALVGFDRRELVTIPPLHTAELWSAFESARRSMLPHFGQEHAAPRYKA